MLPLALFQKNAPSRLITNNDFNKPLAEARHLEDKDAEAALKLYAQLAEQGCAEAVFCHSRMLLQGRGTPREFIAAIEALANIAARGHEQARQRLIPLQERLTLLENLVGNFYDLNTPGDLPLRMPLRLQCAIVEAIMSTKGMGGNTQSSTITHSDISTLFADLLEVCGDSHPKQKHQLQAYKKSDFDTLLTEGVASYNQDNNTHVGILTHEIKLPPELSLYINEYLSMGENIRKARTSKYYAMQHEAPYSWLKRLTNINDLLSSPDERLAKAKEIFLAHLERRKDKYLPCDKTGLAHLVSLDIKQPKLIRGIQNGQLTVRQVQDAKMQLSNLLQLLRMFNDKRIEYLKDGRFFILILYFHVTTEQLYRASEWIWKAICDNAVAEFLKDPHQPQQIMDFSRWAATALSNTWIRDCITSGKFTFDALANITRGGQQALCHPNVQRFLDQNPQYINQVARLFVGAAQALCTDWVIAAIRDGRLSLEQLNNAIPEVCQALACKGVQRFLKKNPTYIDQVMRLSIGGAKALENRWVRARIVDGSLGPEPFETVTEQGWVALANPGVQKFLDENPDFKRVVAGLVTDRAGRALGENLVRKWITNEYITIEQFANASSIGYCGTVEIEYLPELLDLNPDCIKRYFNLSAKSTTKIFNYCAQLSGQLNDQHSQDFVALFNECETQNDLISEKDVQILNSPDIQAFLKKHPQYKMPFLHLLSNDKLAHFFEGDTWLRALLTQEKIKLSTISDFDDGSIMAFSDPAMQAFFNKNPQYLSQWMPLLGDSTETSNVALSTEWVRNRLVQEKLSPSQFANFSISGLTLADKLQEFVNQYPRCLDQIVDIDGYFGHLLVPEIIDCIINGTVTLNHFIGLSEEACVNILHHVNSGFIKQDPQFLAHLIHA